MSYPNAIEVCRAELFTKEVELRERYPSHIVDKRQDSNTMERAATAYGKINRVDLKLRACLIINVTGGVA